MYRICRLLLLSQLINLTVSYAQLTTPTPGQEIRALWVTRWDYHSPADIEQIMHHAAEFHFNLVLLQVRGNGTVFYPSQYEPWAEEFGGIDPGWNPLTTAIEQAHRAGIQLHAWINVLPGWRGTTPPTNPNQLFNAHPNWFMTDEDQVLQPLSSYYVFLNPVLPEVQQHLTNIVTELAATPNLDGIHFDYFRFPGADLGYDPKAQQLFFESTHFAPIDTIQLWDQFRRDAVTGWLRQVYTKVKNERPDFVFSSAIIGDYDNGTRIFLQDSHRWLAEGIIDIVFPMTYTADTRLLQRWLKRHAPYHHDRAICPGLMVYDNSPLLQEQILLSRQLGFPGVALFAYANLFPQHQPAPIAYDLRDSLFTSSTSLPQFQERAKPILSDLYWLPANPTTNDSIRLVSKLTGNVVDDDYQVFGIWENDGLLPDLRKINFQSLSLTPNYWYSQTCIPPQPAGEHLLLRLFAYLSQNAQQTTISSELYQGLIDIPVGRYQAAGAFGPLLAGVTRAAVDQMGSVWLAVPGRGIVVLMSDGSEAPFSPITQFSDEHNKLRPLGEIAGLATLANLRIAILMNDKKKTYLLTNEKRMIDVTFACQLPQPGTDLAINANDEIYVLQGNDWYVANRQGKLLGRFWLSLSHSLNNLAVSPDGKNVFIACRTDATVHHWQGAVLGRKASYRPLTDLSVANMGIGGVSCGKDGSIFLAETPGGFVKVLDRELHLVDFLRNGKPALRAPRLLVPSPDSQTLYILEAGGEASVRMRKWEKIEP